MRVVELPNEVILTVLQQAHFCLITDAIDTLTRSNTTINADSLVCEALRRMNEFSLKNEEEDNERQWDEMNDQMLSLAQLLKMLSSSEPHWCFPSFHGGVPCESM
jgi:hypothetical protein